MTEKELVESYFQIKSRIEAEEAALKDLKNERDKIEYELAEYLFDVKADKTAKYQDIGHVTMTKPDVFAYVLKDDESRMFEWLRDNELGDLITSKVSLHNARLVKVVKTYLDEGKELPDFVRWSISPKVKGYKA